ncbi:hypothetical protein PXK56_18520 [Phaeobacter gallaeciensis]|uniref:hypothetical protein n=1 Tax=Phaeobacter gallaeciensis TaxID=60890 RepID=UPI002380A94A|nr:hypothetical protein [Phaeobacter gallaeciensis]MDE4297182.1 hypothetical protein [Phaeobacter gallaeciensis]
MTNTKAYQAWNSMKQRCMNAKSKDYPRYGGRGIKICDRWLSFENFLADMGEKPRDMTLDRIDNDGDYEPGNCRWASARTQSNNRRSNHCLTYEGKTQTLSEWSRETGIEKATLLNRIKNGWDTKAVLTTSVDYGNGWKNGARN